MRRTKDAISAKSDKTQEAIAQALDDILSAPNYGNYAEVARAMSKMGKYLIAITNKYDTPETSPIALFYATSDSPAAAKGALPMVTTRKWVDEQMAWASEISSEEMNLITDSFLDKTSGLTQPWGVPVDRHTIVKRLPSGVETTYGYIEDTRAVKNSKVPQDLQQELLAVVDSYHVDLRS